MSSRKSGRQISLPCTMMPFVCMLPLESLLHLRLYLGNLLHEPLPVGVEPTEYIPRHFSCMSLARDLANSGTTVALNKPFHNYSCMYVAKMWETCLGVRKGEGKWETGWCRKCVAMGGGRNQHSTAPAQLLLRIARQHHQLPSGAHR